MTGLTHHELNYLAWAIFLAMGAVIIIASRAVKKEMKSSSPLASTCGTEAPNILQERLKGKKLLGITHVMFHRENDHSPMFVAIRVGKHIHCVECELLAHVVSGHMHMVKYPPQPHKHNFCNHAPMQTVPVVSEAKRQDRLAQVLALQSQVQAAQQANIEFMAMDYLDDFVSYWDMGQHNTHFDLNDRSVSYFTLACKDGVGWIDNALLLAMLSQGTLEFDKC